MNANRPMVLPAHDVLVRLAREDPAALERLRREMVEECIARAPEAMRPRLRELQLQIDGIRITSPSPLIASQRLQRLMGESVLQLEEAFVDVVRLASGKTKTTEVGKGKTVWRISFIPRERHRPDPGLTDRF